MELVCIECPRGCLLSAEKTEGGVSVSGNFCPKIFFKKHLQFEKKLLY